jgi:myo-inositol-1(or 4)-monophosphatase
VKEFLFDIIKQAGKISLEYKAKLSSMEVTKKTDKDLVSEGDLAVEAYLIDRIKAQYPSHAILGEESGSYGDDQYRWIIDPIDGTTSFVHGQPFYSISIALEKDGDIILGAVNAPVLNELFHAEKGQGAFSNGEAICVSTRDKLIDSVLGTGFACVRSDLEHDNLPYFNKILPNIRGIRRYGSCAIDLSYVASGRLEGFWELNLNLYDMAAGLLILTEAGGRVTDFSGDTGKLPGQLVATNGLIHNELLTYLTQSD